MVKDSFPHTSNLDLLEYENTVANLPIGVDGEENLHKHKTNSDLGVDYGVPPCEVGRTTDNNSSYDSQISGSLEIHFFSEIKPRPTALDKELVRFIRLSQSSLTFLDLAAGKQKRNPLWDCTAINRDLLGTGRVPSIHVHLSLYSIREIHAI